MRFLIIDGVKISGVEALTKAEAAAKYARRRLPHDLRSQLSELRVLDLGLATKFNCLVTRNDDHIESTAKEVFSQANPDQRKDTNDACRF